MATKVETVTLETPERAIDDTPTLKGEVVDPMQDLKQQEQIVHKGWKVAQKKAAEVYEALTIIYTRDLWKLHLNSDGKRQYKAFDKYLFGEFGWDMSRARAHQIIREFQPKLVAAGKLDDTEIPEKRARTAPEITAAKACVVTQQQFQGVLDAFFKRIDNIEKGEGRDALADLFEDIQEDLGAFFAELETIKMNDEAKVATPAQVEDGEPDETEEEEEDTEGDVEGDEDEPTVVGG